MAARIGGRHGRPGGVTRLGFLDEAFALGGVGHAANRRDACAKHEEWNLRKAGDEAERAEHTARHVHRARMSTDLCRERGPHARAAGGMRHHDTGGGADDQRRDLRDEAVANGEHRVLREGLTDR